MTIRSNPFNILLLWLAMALGLAAGCMTTREGTQGKEATVLRFHLEVNPDGTHHNIPISVYGIPVNVQRDPFLDEGSIQEAAVVDSLGGFSLKVRFDHHGTLVLDNMTTASKGQRIAVFSQFGQARWLAAPVINRRISDGVFVFTPDATKEEAERIVKGLNNVAKAIKKRS
ncbi:MAG: hypothetical protein HY674_03325 [Chloroflexi bacterium]|nr:hypothetical protein [Chloroflexota bacterium]